MKKTRTNSQYTVDCDVKKLHEDDEKREYVNTVSTQLDAIHGINDSDYNGHYGNVVFFTLDTDKDNPETWAKIKKVLKPFLI